MPLEMSVEDLKRDLVGCVVMHKNKPVYVTAIGRGGAVSFRCLNSQREDVAPFTLADFASPIRRVGFVNIMNSVIYITRIPVRRYHMGLYFGGGGRGGNIKISHLDCLSYPQGGMQTLQRAQTMCIPEIGKAIMNKYPSISEAWQQVKDFGGACAFDKQFAVAENRYVIYKSHRVGKFPAGAESIQDIKWDEGKQHLSILLENNHEKTVRDFRPATC